MKLTKEQKQEIIDQQSQKNITKRVTSNELEKILYEVLPVSTVKCLCSGGRNEGGREATPTSISIFDFYGIKTL